VDLNKVMLIGNVGQDPTFHKMTGDAQLAKFSVATSRKWKDKATGDKKEETSWHNIVVFSPYIVALVEKMVQKGTRVYVEGELKTRTYMKDDEKKYITEIILPQVKGELMIIARGKGWKDEGATPDRPAPTVDPGFDDDIPF